MGVYGFAEGEITFTPPIVIAGDDLALLPDDPGPCWARLVVAEDGTGTALRAVVEEEERYVSGIAFEVDHFARSHPELEFTGHIDYCDDSGHCGDRWRITVVRRNDRNRTYLTRPKADGTWPDPRTKGGRMKKDRWPEGW